MTNELLPACSAALMRAVCPHARLFEDEYKRCFPHCCPKHVDRSYCGSPLEVLVRFGFESNASQSRDHGGQDGSPSFDITKVFVFARFETLGGDQLPAASHSLSYLRSVSQSEWNPEASWIEGVCQPTEARLQHSHQVYGYQPSLRTQGSPESATFLLNGQPYAKWYYHWGSGANKVQRSTKHVLKAYVFYQTQATQVATQASNGVLDLLCTVTSPSFTVVSYRRAPDEVSGSSALGSTRLNGVAPYLPHYASGASQPTDADLRFLVHHHISRAFQAYNQHQHDGRDSFNRSFLPLGAAGLQEVQRGDQVASSERGQGRLLPDFRFRQLPHGQILPGRQQPTFESARPRDDHWNWRDTGETATEGKGNSIRDEAVPQPRSVRHEAPPYEPKPPAMVGIPPPRTGIVSQISSGRSAAVLRFMQLRQPDNHQRELQQLTDLAIVHLFATRFTATGSEIPSNMKVVLVNAVGLHWQFAASEATQLATLLLDVAEDASYAVCGQEKAQGLATTSTKLEQLKLLLGEVCVWAFTPENLQLMQHLLNACHPLLLSSLGSGGVSGGEDGGKELRTAFMECVKRCWSALNGFLQTRLTTDTPIQSVRELSDAIVGAVHSISELQALRLDLRDLLQRPAYLLVDSKTKGATTGSSTPSCNLVGWQSFVAQVREGYLRDQHSGRDVPRCPKEDTNSRSCRWTADWALQPDSLSIGRHRASQRLYVQEAHAKEGDIPSLWTSCLGLSQLLHLKLAVSGDPLHTLYVQAEPSLLFCGNVWLQLICDGRLRVAPVTPNGLTSLIGGAVGGDYIAYRLEPANADVSSSNEDDSICLEFYWWPLESTERVTRLTAFRVVATLKTAANGALIDAHVNLERGCVEPDVLATASTPRLELWAPSERLQAVSGWLPWLSIEGIYARK